MGRPGWDICEGALPSCLGTWPVHTADSDCLTRWHWVPEAGPELQLQKELRWMRHCS